jgi:drug/metabolite transporter (DMT)-like permease
MRPVKQSALFRLALLALIWGSSFLWIKVADRGFAPVEVTFARLALGSAALFPVVAARREALPRSAALWARIALAALFANAIPYLLFAVAEQSVDSSTAGVINATTPLWAVTLALAVRHQKSVTARQCAGLVVGFAGTLLIFSPWHSASSVASAGGLECLAASISYAISYVYMDRFLARRGMSPSRSRHASSWWQRRCSRPHCRSPEPGHRRSVPPAWAAWLSSACSAPVSRTCSTIRSSPVWARPSPPR